MLYNVVQFHARNTAYAEVAVFGNIHQQRSFHCNIYVLRFQIQTNRVIKMIAYMK